MNCKSIKLVLMGGLVGCLISIGVTVGLYETKISTIENTKQMEIELLKTEKSNTEMERSTYKYLYDTEQKTIEDYRVQAKQSLQELDTLKNKIYLSKESELKVSRGDYPSKDLSQYAIMTVDELNDWIKERAPKDSPFIGKAEVFLKASQQQKLDPKFLVASSALESGWGRSQISRLKSNYFGITAYNATPLSSATEFKPGLENGIVQGAAWIKQMYYDEGQTSLNKMIYGKKAYCQTDNGQPSDLWIPKVTAIIYNTNIS